MEAFTQRERRKIISLYQAGWDTEDIAANSTPASQACGGCGSSSVKKIAMHRRLIDVAASRRSATSRKPISTAARAPDGSGAGATAGELVCR